MSGKREPVIATIEKGSLISTYALAAILGVSERSVKRWVEQNDIPRVSIAGKWLIDVDAIAESMRE